MHECEAFIKLSSVCSKIVLDLKEICVDYFLARPGYSYTVQQQPLDHWPFRQQAAKQPTVSPEVTYGGIEKQVSLFRWLWFPKLVSLLRIYQTHHKFMLIN